MGSSNTTKALYFEYFLHKLYDKISNKENNDLSIIKTQKLLYFLINSVPGNNRQYPLINTFDNFYALPYGHVESDIYDSIKSKSIQSIDIDRFGLRIKSKDSFDFNTLNKEIKDLIEKGIEELSDKQLLEKNSSYLVELSHCHDSWIQNYRIALKENRLSKDIKKEEIIAEDKFFAL